MLPLKTSFAPIKILHKHHSTLNVLLSHYRISSIVWHCVLGNAPSYLLELFMLTSACSGRQSLRSATKGDFLVQRARTATRQRKGLSRSWVPLFGMVFPLNFVLCRGTIPVLFINSSRLSPLAEPGLGAPLGSYLEGALYKLIYR